MGDASMSVEQGAVTEQQSQKPVIPETPQQEVLSPLTKHIDLETFYDSFNGLNHVSKSSYKQFNGFYLVEKL